MSDEKKCENCEYWENLSFYGDGNCHKFPKKEITCKDYWCSEFKIKEEIKIEVKKENCSELIMESENENFGKIGRGIIPL